MLFLIGFHLKGEASLKNIQPVSGAHRKNGKC